MICNTTPIRHFALIGRFDLLVRLVGGVVRTPRQVLDPEEDTGGPASLLSEIGRSENHYEHRSRAGDRTERWGRLFALRKRQDIEIIDLDDDETTTYGEITTASYAQTLGYVAPLGSGEAAVVAVAEHRQWDAVIDDAQGRDAFADRVPGRDALTSRELLRAGVANGSITSDEAETVYSDLLDGGYRGPATLW